MPTGTVTPVTIQIQPHAIVRHAVAPRQTRCETDEWLMRHGAKILVLRRQPRLEELLIEYSTEMLLPRYTAGEHGKELVGAAQPTRNDLDPRICVEMRAGRRAEGVVDPEI